MYSTYRTYSAYSKHKAHTTHTLHTPHTTHTAQSAHAARAGRPHHRGRQNDPRTGHDQKISGCLRCPTLYFKYIYSISQAGFLRAGAGGGANLPGLNLPVLLYFRPPSLVARIVIRAQLHQIQVCPPQSAKPGPRWAPGSCQYSY